MCTHSCSLSDSSQATLFAWTLLGPAGAPLVLHTHNSLIPTLRQGFFVCCGDLEWVLGTPMTGVYRQVPDPRDRVPLFPLHPRAPSGGCNSALTKQSFLSPPHLLTCDLSPLRLWPRSPLLGRGKLGIAFLSSFFPNTPVCLQVSLVGFRSTFLMGPRYRLPGHPCSGPHPGLHSTQRRFQSLLFVLLSES